MQAVPDLELAATIAGSSEELGYATVWTNDALPGDGITVALRMLHSTEKIRVGIGAVPTDRRPVAEVIDRLKGEPDLGRLVLVLGAGGARSLQSMREGVAAVREGLGSDLTVGVAAMGQQMCRLGGEIADFVLLNWMNPDRIAWARGEIRAGAEGRAAGLTATEPEVGCYVRVALGQGAGLRVAAEAARYNQLPQYHANFAAMGVASTGIGAPDSSKAPEMAEPYEAVLDEMVVRPIVTIPASENPDLNEVFEALGTLMEVGGLFAPSPPTMADDEDHHDHDHGDH